MSAACMAEAADLKLVPGLLSAVDCSIADVVKTGYGALMGPGSQLMLGLTALLTIYIAVLGLRIMLGLGSLRVGDITVVAVKIGVVLALATNWPLYQQLIFNTLFNGPEQIAGQLLGVSSASGPPIGGLQGRLQVTFDEMQASAAYFGQHSPGSSSPWLGGAPMGAAALNIASLVMLVSTLGVLLGVKLLLAALLVAGPFFVGLLLFDSTRGVFVGWLRACIALALVPMMAMLALVLELNLVQPHLVKLAEMRTMPMAENGPAIAVLVITLTAAVVSLAGVMAAGVIGMSLRLPSGSSRTNAGGGDRHTYSAAGPDVAYADTRGANPLQLPPRIASVAAAAAAMDRRDSRLLIENHAGPGASATGGAPTPFAVEAAAPLGRSHRRAAQPSLSASSQRRDR